MFFIRCRNAESLKRAIFLLAGFSVIIHPRADDPHDPNSASLMVMPGNIEDDFVLAEVAMQNHGFTQVGNICPYCNAIRVSNEPDTCGHLTFE